MRYIVVLLLALGVAPFASAQPTQGYYGISFGSLDYEEGDGDGGTLVSDSASIYRLLAGYEFNDYFAVEGGYGKSGTLRSTYEDANVGTIDIKTEDTLMVVRAVGMLPLNNFTLYGALGYANTKQKYALSGGVNGSDSFDDSSTAVALGVQFDVGDRLGIRAEYEKLGLDGLFDSADATDVTVTLMLRF